jgi:hypothetical protein
MSEADTTMAKPQATDDDFYARRGISRLARVITAVVVFAIGALGGAGAAALLVPT